MKVRVPAGAVRFCVVSVVRVRSVLALSGDPVRVEVRAVSRLGATTVLSGCRTVCATGAGVCVVCGVSRAETAAPELCTLSVLPPAGRNEGALGLGVAGALARGAC